MGRFDTRFHAPPVRIGLAQARTQQTALVEDTSRLGRAAGNFGQKERRNASVPMRLRIGANAGPNSPIGVTGTKPVGRTQRKRGYPPITLPGPQAGA